MSQEDSPDVYCPLRAGNSDGAPVFHDKALIKADQSHHKVAKFGKERRTLFVWDLSYKTKEEEIRNFFESYGDVRRVDVIRDVVTRISKGYAFVEFKRTKDAIDAEKKGDRTILAGRPVRCQMKVGGVLKGWRPRRLGGGFGGRKESGQLRFGGKDHPFANKISTLKEKAKTYPSTPAKKSDEWPRDSRARDGRNESRK